MKTFAAVSVLCLAATLASSGALARASAPPVASVGPLSAPNGAGTASGSAAPDGATDACVNNQHSGVDPSSSSATSAVQLSDHTCNTVASAPAQTSSAQASKRRTPAQSSSSSASATSGGAAQSSAVTAAEAVGLRIASIRVDARRIAKTRRLRVLVTVRDQRKRMVLHARISLSCPHAARGVAGCTQTTFSNRHGQAAFPAQVWQKGLPSDAC